MFVNDTALARASLDRAVQALKVSRQPGPGGEGADQGAVQGAPLGEVRIGVCKPVGGQPHHTTESSSDTPVLY